MKQRGGPGRGQGRKPIKEGEDTVTVSLRMTTAQRDKLALLGGAEWVRQRIDKAKTPNSDFSSFLDAYKLWKSAVDFARNQNNLSNNIAEHMKTTYRTCPKCPHGLGFKCKKCWPN